MNDWINPNKIWNMPKILKKRYYVSLENQNGSHQELKMKFSNILIKIPAIILLVVYIFTESSDAGCFSIIFAIMSGLCCGMGESIKNNEKNKKNKIVPIRQIV